MTVWRTLGEILTRWTDTVAAGVVTLASRVVSPRVLCLIEDETKTDVFILQGGKATGEPITFSNNQFSGGELNTLAQGSRIELSLQPNRFLVRPLELPAGASEFIEGIVRAQIDRLTPWTAGEAVFGCTAPTTARNGKIVTTIAASTRAATAPYIAALAALRPASMSVFTRGGEQSREMIKVFEQQARGLLDRQRLSRLLRLVLAGVAAVAVLACVADILVANYLDGHQAEINSELTARRIALRLDRNGADISPVAALARRKNLTQASVIAIEELSRILPDNTYVTELHIDGNTLQVAGVTSDAPSLIRLMEQSRHFARATFFAPTTHAPSDPGDRFHIEARLQPVNSVTR
jgi:general secretion pathway protein L